MSQPEITSGKIEIAENPERFDPLMFVIQFLK